MSKSHGGCLSHFETQKQDRNQISDAQCPIIETTKFAPRLKDIHPLPKQTPSNTSSSRSAWVKNECEWVKAPNLPFHGRETSQVKNDMVRCEKLTTHASKSQTECVPKRNSWVWSLFDYLFLTNKVSTIFASNHSPCHSRPWKCPLEVNRIVWYTSKRHQMRCSGQTWCQEQTWVPLVQITALQQLTQKQPLLPFQHLPPGGFGWILTPKKLNWQRASSSMIIAVPLHIGLCRAL